VNPSAGGGLGQVRRTHFVAIGGAGLSAMALVLYERGVSVSGSDAADSPAVARLRARGVPVTIGHAAENVGAAELVVRSRAIDDSNPEVVEARRRGIPVWDRTAAMVALMEGKRGVGITGTHGKTSTTAMLTLVLRADGRDPSFIVGGEVRDLGDNGHSGSDELMVVEADESDGTFVALPCEAGLVTSVEPDHMEHFGTVERLHADFAGFVARLKGPRVVYGDDTFLRTLPSTVQYGTRDDAAYRLRSVDASDGGSVLDVESPRGRLAVPFRLAAHHFALNATGALALALELGAEPAAAVTALGAYRGVARRFEERGTAGGVRVVDDFAHLPAEVACTIAASAGAGFGAGRVVAVFQPHRYSRTESMWREFGPAFRGAACVVVTDVYGGPGEEAIPGVTGELVARAVREALPGVDVVYVADRSEVAPTVAGLVKPGDVVLSMGAGNIGGLADELLPLLGGAA